MRVLRVGTLECCISVLIGAAAAAAGSQIASFRASTYLVTVNVVVTDKEGNAVIGLDKSDFQILDNGNAQNVSFFYPLKSGPREHVEYAPDTYTNQLASSAQPGAVAILFDTINSRFSSQAFGLAKIRAFLRQLSPEDHIAIYVLGEDGLEVVHDLSEDSADLIQAIQHYDQAHRVSGINHEADSPDTTEVEELDRFLRGNLDRYHVQEESSTDRVKNKYDRQAYRERALQTTIAALQEIARHFEIERGRRSLIWVTDSLPLPLAEGNAIELASNFNERYDGRRELPIDVEGIVSGADGRSLMSGDELELMLRTLNSDNICLYPVSAEGLQTLDLGFKSLPQTRSLVTENTSEEVIEKVWDASNTDHNGMRILAQDTGGRAYIDRNDLQTGLRRALDDTRYTYELAYYPDHGNWRGEWRKITVKVKRPGVSVLARGGYFAMPDPKPLPPRARRQFLAQIAASPLDSTQLPVTVRIGGVTEASVEVKVEIRAGTLFESQVPGRWRCDFQVTFFQLTNEKKILDVTAQDVTAQLQGETYEAALKRGVNTVQKLQRKAAASLLCVVVRDKHTDKVGSVRVPLAQYRAYALPN